MRLLQVLQKNMRVVALAAIGGGAVCSANRDRLGRGPAYHRLCCCGGVG